MSNHSEINIFLPKGQEFWCSRHFFSLSIGCRESCFYTNDFMQQLKNAFIPLQGHTVTRKSGADHHTIPRPGPHTFFDYPLPGFY
jgi:hypothetical protein